MLVVLQCKSSIRFPGADTPDPASRAGKGEERERIGGRERKGKENGDRPPTSFGSKVARMAAQYVGTWPTHFSSLIMTLVSK